MRISDWSSDVCSSDLMSSRPLQVLQSLELGTVVAAQVPGQAAGCPQGFQRSHDRYRTRSKQGDRAKALAVENVHPVEYPVPPAGCQLIAKEIARPSPAGHPDERGPSRSAKRPVGKEWVRNGRYWG